MIKTLVLVDGKIDFNILKSEYLKDSINYYISKSVRENPIKALSFAISLILSLFLFKNIFNYFALYFITF